MRTVIGIMTGVKLGNKLYKDWGSGPVVVYSETLKGRNQSLIMEMMMMPISIVLTITLEYPLGSSYHCRYLHSLFLTIGL